jgi:hypothetical protein
MDWSLAYKYLRTLVTLYIPFFFQQHYTLLLLHLEVKQDFRERERDHGEYRRDSGRNREVGFSFTFTRKNIHASVSEPRLICLQVCSWICQVLWRCSGFCSHQKTFFIQVWRSLVRTYVCVYIYIYIYLHMYISSPLSPLLLICSLILKEKKCFLERISIMKWYDRTGLSVDQSWVFLITFVLRKQRKNNTMFSKI